jgi:sec-independent protein translocase protein TatA
MLGAQELVLVFLIILVLFGASRLPQLGRGLGEGISNFKRGLKGGDGDRSLPADASKDEVKDAP